MNATCVPRCDVALSLQSTGQPWSSFGIWGLCDNLRINDKQAALHHFPSSTHFEMSDVKACVNAVVQNALTVIEHETGMTSHSFHISVSLPFIFCPEIALGDLTVLTAMNTALACVPCLLCCCRHSMPHLDMLIAPFSEKYSTIADQVAAAASTSFELQAQNEKAPLLHRHLVVC